MASFYEPYESCADLKAVTEEKQDQTCRTEILFQEHIGANRYIACGYYNDLKYVGIRQYYYDNDHKLKPSKKGINLSVDQFNAMIRLLPDINKAL